MTTRTATCSCGQLSALCEGEPNRITVCHCTWCQRRTGSVFGVGAYYRHQQVTVSGDVRKFARPAPGGRTLVNQFCPHCGTTLFWTGDLFQGLTGVALGAFTVSTFGKPVRSIWTKHRRGWFHFDPDIATYEEGVPQALEDE